MSRFSVFLKEKDKAASTVRECSIQILHLQERLMCCMYQRGRLFVFFFTVVAMKKHLSSQREGCHLMKSPNFCVKVLRAFEIT